MKAQIDDVMEWHRRVIAQAMLRMQNLRILSLPSTNSRLVGTRLHTVQVYCLGEHGYYLGPSNLMKRKWVEQGGAAKHQYVASDIDYYVDQFVALEKRYEALIDKLKLATKRT
jgi:hypothetical protein